MRWTGSMGARDEYDGLTEDFVVGCEGYLSVCVPISCSLAARDLSKDQGCVSTVNRQGYLLTFARSAELMSNDDLQ